MTTDNNDDLEQSKPVDNGLEQFEPQSTDETPPPVESKAKIIKMRKPRAKKPAAKTVAKAAVKKSTKPAVKKTATS